MVNHYCVPRFVPGLLSKRGIVVPGIVRVPLPKDHLREEGDGTYLPST